MPREISTLQVGTTHMRYWKFSLDALKGTSLSGVIINEVLRAQIARCPIRRRNRVGWADRMYGSVVIYQERSQRTGDAYEYNSTHTFVNNGTHRIWCWLGPLSKCTTRARLVLFDWTEITTAKGQQSAGREKSLEKRTSVTFFTAAT